MTNTRIRISSTAIDETIDRILRIECKMALNKLDTTAINQSLTWAIYRGRMSTEGLVELINLSDRRIQTMLTKMVASIDGSTEGRFHAMCKYLNVEHAA